ncbi:type IIL restriction-modification enzyme MmeI, partial [Dolichospermum sp. UHCC 0260]|uniref:type IIL restriction-modification enzyme MmeI n=1 Tax=Dolichospermum sp. UHCC 0260 TaxID=2590025 RepID=UPI0016A0E659|nr:restriction endonuclease [Dolichospermum sp. UHCC 0260]
AWSPSRWVINFKDWPLDAENDDPKNPKGRPYASDYPDCLAIVIEKVKPEREKNKDKQRREIWWRFTRPTIELYSAIANMERVLLTSRHNKILIFELVTTREVFSEALSVIASDKFSTLALLQSSIHSFWAWQFCSTIRDAGIRYSPTDGFETFPFPTSTANLEQIGEKYYTHRQKIMLTRQEGLTKTYNRFHNPDETNPDIEELRTLHIEMDNAVAAAYGWEDIELDHDFHDTKQGIRFTICENARREILDRLLQLNHQRYAEEVAEGLHDKGKKKAKGGGKKKVQEEVNNDVKQIEMF